MRFLILAATAALFLLGPAGNDPVYPSRYHEPLPTESLLPTTAEASILRLVAGAFRKHGIDPPVVDASIAAACRGLCRVLDCPRVDEGTAFESQTIQFALRRFGTTDSLFFPVVATVRSTAGAGKLLQEIVSRNLLHLGVNRFGLAWDEETGMLVTVFARRLAQLGPFPMAVEPGSTHLLWGSLAEGAGAPVLYFATPDGGLLRTTMTEKAGLFWGQIYFPEDPGVYTIELLVHEDGPQVASLFLVYVGVPVPDKPVLKVYPRTDENVPRGELESQALSLINRERKKRGVEPCALSRGLARGALGHSRAMAEEGRLVHGTGGDGDTENISLSTTVAGAHANLMACPSHRRNILDEEARYCGVGIADVRLEEGVRLLYMTQRFARKN